MFENYILTFFIPLLESEEDSIWLKTIELFPIIASIGHDILESLADLDRLNEIHTVVGANKFEEEENEDREEFFSNIPQTTNDDFEDKSWSR